AINDLTDLGSIAYLTRYDSTHGRFPGKVEVDGDVLRVNGHEIQVLSEPQVSALPWQQLGIDLVMECSGSFSDRASAEQHLHSGAARVLFSQPAHSDVDATVIYGINHDQLQASHRIISNASCTTNCVVPVIKCLDDAFGIDHGVITTIHS